jgi:DNA helicase-2/ATP-dependent DNA helicase PcrA
MTSLNTQQLEAVTHINGPLLVIAGAGSGKTRIVTQRICHLIKSGVHPSQILAVTFTNKAAEEMRERVATALEGSLIETYPTICTFHSLGAKILRESIFRLGYSSNFTIYDEEDIEKLIRAILQQLGSKHERGDIKNYRSFMSSFKSKLMSPDDVDEEDLAKIYRLYQERLKEANAVDFDDLLYLTVKLLLDDKEARSLYQNRWRYLLIDEYQDTNHAQYMMANVIVENTHNLFVVGDPDQSIYSWRGANISNILNFERDYPGSKVIRLEQNYRSRSNILRAANGLIQHNLTRLEKNLWSDRGEGPKIGLFVADDGLSEAHFIIKEIMRLHVMHKVPFSEMTIFYRTNFQSRLFEDALLCKKIPYVIVGGVSFYQRKEIKDILAYLRMLASDTDTLSFVRTINLPKRGLGQKTLESILVECRGSILNFCQHPQGVKLREAQKTALAEYANILISLRELVGKVPLQKLIIEVIRQTHYLEALKEDKETYEDRKANLDELISKAKEWDMSHDGGTLIDFLEELSLRSSLDEADFAEDRVNLMTLHNGKGLEFNVAFIVGMEEDLFPHVNSRESHDQLEEERRLCYVGMTRAKEILYLTASETRLIWGSYRKMRPSRFLREIPREFLQRIDRS